MGKRFRETGAVTAAVLSGLFIVMKAAAAMIHDPKDIDDQNPYLHPQEWGSLGEAMKDVKVPEHREPAFRLYDSMIKKPLGTLMSFLGLVLLSPLYAILALAIKIDDPGPVFFRQKRVGAGKKFFMLHKFRSMKMSTPHDTPTHMLEDPDQYITRVGRFLRKTSLDELPQIWDIFRGKMAVVGPRPALWNQADLVAEREKYGANDVAPGLTGWAQINGRDELEIPEKARIDGEYVKNRSFSFDVRCFFGTFLSVARQDGVVEGGTGELRKKTEQQG